MKAKRCRTAKWPDLEAAVADSIAQAEHQQQTPITHEGVRKRASFFWNQLPNYRVQAMPGFSNGWLSAFQRRAPIRNPQRSKEDGKTLESARKAMIPIRQALQVYHPEDVFNCDETSLYWKQTPDQNVSTPNLPGEK